jgi:hypothetical protein
VKKKSKPTKLIIMTKYVQWTTFILVAFVAIAVFYLFAKTLMANMQVGTVDTIELPLDNSGQPYDDMIGYFY